jgi:hypothetical protein
VLTCLKPAVEIWRLAHGADRDPGAPLEPKGAMIMCKIIERVFESIPAAILQTVTLLDHADARSAWAVASIVIACVATAFVATTIAFNLDTDPEGRHHCPQFYGCADSPRPPPPVIGLHAPLPSRFAWRQAPRACCRYMGDTAASKARCFCALFVGHLVQISLRTATLSLLVATRGWLAAVYLVGDFLLFIGYKALRRDVLYWPPRTGVRISLLVRFLVKVFTDSTSCVHFRHPVDLGGLCYCLNVFLGQALPPFSACPGGRAQPCVRGLILLAAQAAAFASVALYAAFYVGEAKLEAATLYAFVSTLTAVSIVSFGVLLVTMERKYVRTFFSAQTGGEFVMSLFLDNDGNDELRADVFYNNQELWRPIRPQVQAWLRSHFRTWKQTKPAWFTDALVACIPTDMLPVRDARRLSAQAPGGRRSTVHDADASLTQRMSVSLGVSTTPAVALAQVAPLDPAEADVSDPDSDSEAESSDSEAPPHETDTNGAGAA